MVWHFFVENWVWVSGVTVMLVLLGPLLAGSWVIGERQSGLVVKLSGPPLAPGQLVATQGEAGYQARLLPPGWHHGLWRWRYRVTRVPVQVVSQDEIALVVAADGAAIPPQRMLGKEVECDHFQDGAAFLRNGGERGRQLGFLTAGTYRINPAMFTLVTAAESEDYGLEASALRVLQIPSDQVGVVTVLDGHPITSGDLAGPIVPGHDSFQHGEAFIRAGGCRGLQEEVLLSGAWRLNPWLVRVELSPMTEVPIGYVGVVVSYVGREHLDVSGDAFTHGDLVEKGRKGVWVEPLLPGKHPLNQRVMKVELVPTTNIVLNWATRTEAHHYDEKLSPIRVRSMDGFSFTLDVSQIIHIGVKNAPRVISRVGSMQNLVDHVLQPTVANYFRNSAQEVSVLEFLSARSERQKQAFQAIRAAVEAYDVECIDTLIGDIVPPEALMKTQTDRKIADEMRRTFEVQREAQMKRQDLERETAVANLQAEVVRSEQMVRVAERNAQAAAETAKGQATSLSLQAVAEAQASRLKGEASADAVRAMGKARAESYTVGRQAMGEEPYAALQMASVLAEHRVKLVPDIMLGNSQSGLAEVLIARMLGAQHLPAALAGSMPPAIKPLK